MEKYYLLALIATTIEMAVCLVNARHLWRLRGLSPDRSHRMLTLGNVLCGLMALWVLLMNLVAEAPLPATPVLAPWILWCYMVMNIVMTLYPISVIQPEWLSPRKSFFLFLPTLILGLAFILFTGRWTPLATPADIWEHAWAPDVLLRLVTLFIMLPYCFIILLLPHNYKSSSTSFWWILNYSGGLFIICLLHVVFMLTHLPWILIVLLILVACFFLFSTEYELEERIRPSLQPAEEEPSEAPLPEEVPAPQAEPETVEPETAKPDLWERVCHLMDREKVWKDPDLTLVSLSRLCATNVTYLNRIIREKTGSGFKEMVNKKRVADVVTQLEQNADMDLLAAFFNAGYRSRTTAWRNFKEITGQSPAEYKQGLKKS